MFCLCCCLFYVYIKNILYIKTHLCSVKTFACKQTRTCHVPTLTMDNFPTQPNTWDPPQLPMALPCQVVHLRRGTLYDISLKTRTKVCWLTEDGEGTKVTKWKVFQHVKICWMEIILVRLKHGSVVHRLSSMISAVQELRPIPPVMVVHMCILIRNWKNMKHCKRRYSCRFWGSMSVFSSFTFSEGWVSWSHCRCTMQAFTILQPGHRQRDTLLGILQSRTSMTL